MQACREGGRAIEQALRALDAAYFDVLFREGVRTLRDAAAARDAVQETFIKVWRRCSTFQAQSELLPWIRAILRNDMLDRLRRRGRELLSPCSLLVWSSLLASAASSLASLPRARAAGGACAAVC